MFYKAVLAVSLLAGFSGQLQQSSNTETYTLAGTVVNSVTGEPIPGAWVRESLGGGRAVRAGADGKFEFADVPAGTTILSAAKPGYFEVNAGNRSLPAASVVVGPNMGGVLLKLVPEGIIFGRISGEDGEPVEGLQVQVLAQQVRNGKGTREAVGTATTDDEGQFRVAELPRGKYFVSAGAFNQGEATEKSFDAMLVGYGTVFYPGVTDFSAAIPLEIAPGKHAELNMKMVRRQVYRVSGTVSGLPNGQGAILLAMDSDGQNIGQFPVDATSGKFVAEGLPGGACVLLAMSQSGDAPQPHVGSVALQLTSDVTGVRLQLAPTVVVFAYLHVEKTRNENSSQSEASDNAFSRFSQFAAATGSEFGVPTLQAVPAAMIVLAPRRESLQQAQFGFEASGDPDATILEAQGVFPGEYNVMITPTGAYYVESAKAGSVNLLEQDLVIAAGAMPPPLEIVLRDDGASLAVNAVRDGVRVAGTVIVIPDGGLKLLQSEMTDANGMVQFNNLAPGHYRVVALEDESEAEFQSADFQRKYALQGQEITLAPNQKASLSMELAGVAE
jgi:hypothetical protein